MRNIGKNIRLARVNKNMKQEELAERLFITRQTVSNYENGKSRPDVDMLASIAKTLDVEINELIYGKQTEPVCKKEKIKLLIATSVLVLFTVAVSVLTPFFKELAIVRYVIFPLYFLRFLIIPALFLLSGWISLQLLFVFFGLKKPAFPARKPIFFAFVTATAIMFVLILITLILSTVFEITVPVLMNKHFSRLFYFIGKYPYISSTVGALLWLTDKK